MKKLLVLLSIALMFLSVQAFTLYGYDGTRYAVGTDSEVLGSYDQYPYPGLTSFIPYYDDTYAAYGNYAYAPSTPYNYGNFDYRNFPAMNGNCYNLDVVSHSITAKEGETRTELFHLKNYTNTPFYIDEINVVSESTAVEVLPVGSLYSADPDSRTAIELSARALNAERDEVGLNYLEITGHFPNGRICKVVEDFYVYVDVNERTACDSFELNVPASMELIGTGVINVSVSNPSSETALVKVSAKNAVVSPREFKVLPGEQSMKTVRVEGFQGETGTVYYNISMPGCEFLQRTTSLKLPKPIQPTVEEKGSIEVNNLSSEVNIADTSFVSLTLTNTARTEKTVNVNLAGLPQTFTVRPLVVGLFPNETKALRLEVKVNGEMPGKVFAKLVVDSEFGRDERNIEFNVFEVPKAEIKALEPEIQADGSMNLRVALKNNLSGVIRGIIDFGFPEGWEVKGNNVVELGPLEEKTVAFKVIPSEQIDKATEVFVRLVNNQGQLAATKTVVEPGTNLAEPMNVALAVLGGRAVNLGLIVLLALVALFLWGKIKEGNELSSNTGQMQEQKIIEDEENPEQRSQKRRAALMGRRLARKENGSK